MWNKTSYERYMDKRLTADLGSEKAETITARFVSARDKVLREIRQIAAVEPSLSDHGPDHIANVLENVYELIATVPATHPLSGMNLYILGIVVLFHDTGNLRGREGHHLNIADIFDWARGIEPETRREKTLVLTAVRAHTGQTAAGGWNTLQDVPVSDHVNGCLVQLRDIAALLRFADELSEGPQRTSEFFRTHIGYNPNAQIFHRYASCTHPSVDRGNERICLTYEIQLSEFPTSVPMEQHAALTDFLTFVFHRIAKLDEERRYARFYCPILAAFKQTDIAINFYDGPSLLPLAITFQLDDLIVPGEHKSTLNERFPQIGSTPTEIAEQVLSKIGMRGIGP
jgi:hypothetical protein